MCSVSTKALIWEKSGLAIMQVLFFSQNNSQLNLYYGLKYIQKYFGILPHLLLTLSHIWSNLAFLPASPSLCWNSESIQSFTNFVTPTIVTRCFLIHDEPSQGFSHWTHTVLYGAPWVSISSHIWGIRLRVGTTSEVTCPPSRKKCGAEEMTPLPPNT